MTSLLYLLREPVNSISPALYASGTGALVIGIEAARPEISSTGAEVIHPGSDTRYAGGQILSFTDLLELVMSAGKVITL